MLSPLLAQLLWTGDIYHEEVIGDLISRFVFGFFRRI